MAKHARTRRWTVYMLRAKANRIGTVWAEDEASALRTAIDEVEIRKTDRFRLQVGSARAPRR